MNSIGSVSRNSASISDVVDSSNINKRIKRELDDLENSNHTESKHVSIKREIPVILDRTTIKGSGCVILSSNIYMPYAVYNRIYPHQQENLKWLADLHNSRLGGILADEMGMGKTVSVATYIYALMFTKKIDPTFLYDQTLNILLVCPPTLTLQWEYELETWSAGIKITHFNKDLNIRPLLNNKTEFHCIFITYETLRLYIEVIKKIKFLYVILDEGQKIRNPNSMITLCVKTLNTPHRILLSGSPIQNNLIEFWSLFDFCIPAKLGILPLFTELFVQPIRKGAAINATAEESALGHKRARQLREITSPFIQRHLKTDCNYIELPKKSEQVIFCNLSPLQYQLYKQVTTDPDITRIINHYTRMKIDIMEGKSRRFRSEGGFGRLFRVISLLRKICNHPELLKNQWSRGEKVVASGSDDYDDVSDSDDTDSDTDATDHTLSSTAYGEASGKLSTLSGKLSVALDIINEWAKQGHKILFFSQTVKMLNIVEKCIKIPFLRLDGTVLVKRRGEIISKFQNSDIQLFLLTTRVGGVGLNLTMSDRIIIYDPDWNPMIDAQASQRCYRIGQSKPVVILRLINSHTIEEKIYYRQIYKFHLSEKILTNARMERSKAFNDILDLFSCPEPPPNYEDPETSYLSPELKRQLNKIKKLRFKNSNLRLNKALEDFLDDEENDANILAILEKNQIQTVVKHDKTVQSDYKIVEEDKDDEQIINLSANTSGSTHIPTWTGKKGGSAQSIINYPSKSISQTDLRKMIIRFFKTSPRYSYTTSEILDHFGHYICESQKIEFKLLLKKICTLITPEDQNTPKYWKLNSEYRRNSH